jgi:hypothetical protein
MRSPPLRLLPLVILLAGLLPPAVLGQSGTVHFSLRRTTTGVSNACMVGSLAIIATVEERVEASGVPDEEGLVPGTYTAKLTSYRLIGTGLDHRRRHRS